MARTVPRVMNPPTCDGVAVALQHESGLLLPQVPRLWTGRDPESPTRDQTEFAADTLAAAAGTGQSRGQHASRTSAATDHGALVQPSGWQRARADVDKEAHA